MLKKSLIFGSVALFLAALITLTGCPTSADDGSTEVFYGHRIYGKNVTPYEAQVAIDNAVAAGESVVLEHDLTIVTLPGAVNALNFKGTQVKINGAVKFIGGTISVADAQVTWAANAELDLGGPNAGYYILRESQKPELANGVVDGTMVEFVERVQDIMYTSERAAVRQFTLGPKQDFDYFTDSTNGIWAKINNPNLTNLYVLDNLTVPGDGNLPDITITALGTVDVTGTAPRGAGLEVGGTKLPLGTSSTLTSSTSMDSVEILVPSPTVLPNVRVEKGKGFSVLADDASFAIPGALTGEGTLEVLGDVDDTIVILGGKGNVKFSGNVAPDQVIIASTGKVTFAKDLTSLSGGDPSEIYSDVVFKGAVRTTAGSPLHNSLELYGNVTLSAANAVTLTTTYPLVLGANKTISLEITPADTKVPAVYPILEAGPSGVKLTPVSGLVLTPGSNPAKDTEVLVNAQKKITLSVAGFEITDGTLQVAQGAILDIAGQTVNTKVAPTLVPPQFGYLAVANGGTLVIGAGSLDIDYTTINAASTIKAEGGTVTLGNNTIAGSVPGTKLSASKGGALTAPLIAVDPNQSLNLAQLDLNLAVYGGLQLKGVDSRITLKKQAKIILKELAGGPTEWRNITTALGNIKLNGNIEAIADTPESVKKQNVVSLAHKGGEAEVSIIAVSSTPTLGKGTITFSP
ncbi:MAG: hypothetical protein LBO65_03875 [Spirochaetaceae bacterium]|jgi:hypothetical protein|nr:hypothetical protein [Spirochaetaceae bacterium]